MSVPGATRFPARIAPVRAPARRGRPLHRDEADRPGRNRQKPFLYPVTTAVITA